MPPAAGAIGLLLSNLWRSSQPRVAWQPHTPLCNAHAERHVREIRETLDNMILLGEPHLRRALRAIQAHHNAERRHQGIGNVIPLDFDYPAEPASIGAIQRAEALGGLLNHYSVRKAA